MFNLIWGMFKEKESADHPWGQCNANKQRRVEPHFTCAIWKKSSKMEKPLNFKKRNPKLL